MQSPTEPKLTIFWTATSRGDWNDSLKPDEFESSGACPSEHYAASVAAYAGESDEPVYETSYFFGDSQNFEAAGTAKQDHIVARALARLRTGLGPVNPEVTTRWFDQRTSA
jgi:hypothetical protein